MRVQNVRELVYWMLAETPGLVAQPRSTRLSSPASARMRRSPSLLPLYWVYVTAWATPDGVVQFRDDIYNRDGFGSQTNTSRG